MEENNEDRTAAEPRLGIRNVSARRLVELITEAAREFGLLWLVFANLDVLVASGGLIPINWRWHLWHTTVAAIIWWIGAYLDARLSTGAER